jgi:hypothetical protein
MRNEEVLQRVKEERKILQRIKRIKANWIGHILRNNCLIQHVIKGKIGERTEVVGRRGRKRKQLLDSLKEKRGYWKFQ